MVLMDIGIIFMIYVRNIFLFCPKKTIAKKYFETIQETIVQRGEKLISGTAIFQQDNVAVHTVILRSKIFAVLNWQA